MYIGTTILASFLIGILKYLLVSGFEHAHTLTSFFGRILDGFSPFK
jgi:hypothetical protein